jgi:hypothetical protein
MDDRKRITQWLIPHEKSGGTSNTAWLCGEMDRINHGDHQCKIQACAGKEALFFLDGYYDNGVWHDVP